jgi:DNA-binding PadR family transcriptional regulator
MAVRDALLALLTMGPAYGFQLHGALEARTGGRRSVNVGQTYATLDRLTKHGLIAPSGVTDDGLPLHALTSTGAAAATAWIGGADAAGADPWDESVDRVLIALSLPGVDAGAVVDEQLGQWRRRLAEAEVAAEAAAPRQQAEAPATTPEAALAAQAARADGAKANAAIAWLSGIDTASKTEYALAPQSIRPKRGRRPGAPAASAEAAGDTTTHPSARA